MYILRQPGGSAEMQPKPFQENALLRSISTAHWTRCKLLMLSWHGGYGRMQCRHTVWCCTGVFSKSPDQVDLAPGRNQRAWQLLYQARWQQCHAALALGLSDCCHHEPALIGAGILSEAAVSPCVIYCALRCARLRGPLGKHKAKDRARTGQAEMKRNRKVSLSLPRENRKWHCKSSLVYFAPCGDGLQQMSYCTCWWYARVAGAESACL